MADELEKIDQAGAAGAAVAAKAKPGEDGDTFHYKGKPMVKRSFEEGFTTDMQQNNNIKYLAETGDNPTDLFMRTSFPNKIDDSYRLMIAFEEELSKSVMFGDTVGETSVRNILAMLPSLGGKSRNELVTTFIGGYFGDKGGDSAGMLEKLKKAAYGH